MIHLSDRINDRYTPSGKKRRRELASLRDIANIPGAAIGDGGGW